MPAGMHVFVWISGCVYLIMLACLSLGPLVFFVVYMRVDKYRDPLCPSETRQAVHLKTVGFWLSSAALSGPRRSAGKAQSKKLVAATLKPVCDALACPRQFTVVPWLQNWTLALEVVKAN